jgi:hypothetical protein
MSGWWVITAGDATDLAEAWTSTVTSPAAGGGRLVRCRAVALSVKSPRFPDAHRSCDEGIHDHLRDRLGRDPRLRADRHLHRRLPQISEHALAMLLEFYPKPSAHSRPET